MNKVYKIIWSKTRDCYVVVSELAKRNAKGSGVRSCRMKATPPFNTATIYLDGAGARFFKIRVDNLADEVR